VHSRDGGECGCDEARHQSVGPSAEPPGRRDSRDGERDDHEPGDQVGRFIGPRLEGGQDVHEQRRVVEPTWVEPTAVAHLPGTRDDALLVGVEDWQGQAVPDAHEPDRGRTGEQGGEGEPGAAPAGFP
jgi:hypothetical protein